MLNTLTMTPEQEKTARDQAFYLLKKYTSFTLLDKARDLYQGFLDAFVKQLNEPLPLKKHNSWVNDLEGYEGEYKEFLGYMIPLEEGLQLLRNTSHKAEAYAAFQNWGGPISYRLFGRYGHEVGMSYDVFFQKLGMTPEDEQDAKPHTGFIKNNVIESKSIVGRANITIAHGDFLFAIDDDDDDADQWHMAFNYYTLFSEHFNSSISDYYKNVSKHIYPFNFPKDLAPCPPHNTNSAGQVWSNEEIPITGIYEPWLINGKVGCPNYFLAGQKAIEYQLEGTQDKETVSWRLLWEDKRYLDGTVPPEEAFYLQEATASVQPSTPLVAYPGQVCPKAGTWFAPNDHHREITLQAGETFPQEDRGATGGIIWYFKQEQSPK